MPEGRKPVKTILRYPSKRVEVHGFVDEELEAGRQAYVVYPLVEESEKMDLRSATEEYERLSAETFKHRRVGLIHGQRSSAEKDQVMRTFSCRGPRRVGRNDRDLKSVSTCPTRR